MMTEIILLILAAAVLITFIVVTARNLPRRGRRNDDRDAYKTPEIERNPGLEEKSQQPAELQVGEADEAVRLSRFQPDVKDAHRAAASTKR